MTAGVLKESDMIRDENSEGEDEDQPYEHLEVGQRPGSSGQPADHSCITDVSNGFDANHFPRSGDIEITPIFKSHESDDSRYFGL